MLAQRSERMAVPFPRLGAAFAPLFLFQAVNKMRSPRSCSRTEWESTREALPRGREDTSTRRWHIARQAFVVFRGFVIFLTPLSPRLPPPPQKKNIPPHPPPPAHKQSAAEIEAQIERVKKRRRESAQRSRARKSLFVKSLEVENRELKRELFRLRAVVEAALAAGHTLHPSALVPPPSFAAAAGAAAAGAAAYFADEREDDDGDDREEEEEESCRGDMGERGASNAAFSSKSTGGVSGRGSPISTDC